MKFFFKRRKRHPILASIYFISLISFVVWMAWDEEPLDYSEMTVELGPVDASINGYTFLDEYLTKNEIEYFEGFQARSEVDMSSFDVFDAQSELEVFPALSVAVERAFGLPFFIVDKSLVYNDLVLVVGGLRQYVMGIILQARVDELSGRSDEALSSLLEAKEIVNTYVLSKGGLIHLFTACSANRMLSEEIAGLMMTSVLSDEVLENALDIYSIDPSLTVATQNAFRQEFHFALSVLDVVSRGSGEWSGETEDASGIALYARRMGMKVILNKVSTQNLFFDAYAEVIREIEKPISQRQFLKVADIEADIEQRGRFPWVRKNAIAPIFISILVPAFEDILEGISLAEIESSALYLSLALRLYHQEHAELPESLSVLVPDYIPGIPTDPFDSEPLRYSKERAIIYSVGNDFIDSNGSELPFRQALGDDEEDDCAEKDKSEPTFLLRFAQ